MAKSEFRKFVDQAQALPDDCVLGHIVWHSISDGAYALDKIDAAFDEYGLNPAFVPSPTSEFNAFEKACTNALRGCKPYPLPDGQVGEVMAIREVTRNDEIVVRHIVREIRDSANRRLRYETVAELQLMRAKSDSRGKVVRGSHRLRGTIFTDKLARGEQKIIREVVDRWDAEFDRLYDFIDGDKARAMVREYLGFLNAVMMKQGVYFVHKTREDELLRLQTVVREVLGDKCEIAMFPIPELKQLRETVIEAFQEEAVKELEEVVTLISKIRKNSKITPNALANATEKYQNTMRKATEYTRVLRCGQDKTAGAAEIALASLDQLRADMQKQMEA